MGWLLNCCNRGFSGFLVPQRREMKNNISQSLDLESFLLFPQEEKGKEKFQTFTLQRLFGLFFFFPPSVLRPVSHLPPFSLRHTYEAKVPFSVAKTSVGLKGTFEVRVTVFHILTRMEEPCGTTTKVVWTLIDLQVRGHT